MQPVGVWSGKSWSVILDPTDSYSNLSVASLSGGVGGARLAVGLQEVVGTPTIIVNTGDDDTMYGVIVAADIDTVTYTLAGIEGPHGWGRAGDTFAVMEELAALGIDTTFRLGDRDLALCLERTRAMSEGMPLSEFTRQTCEHLGVTASVIPITDDPAPTTVLTDDGWKRFQEYFVIGGAEADVLEIALGGAHSRPAPGVLEALSNADVVIIAPSNPPLSIWPILAVPGVRKRLTERKRVIAVSPLFGGMALKGPAARVMASLGLPPGNEGILAAYAGIVTDLVIDTGDAGDVGRLAQSGVTIHVMDTRIASRDASAAFVRTMLGALA